MLTISTVNIHKIYLFEYSYLREQNALLLILIKNILLLEPSNTQMCLQKCLRNIHGVVQEKNIAGTYWAVSVPYGGLLAVKQTCYRRGQAQIPKGRNARRWKGPAAWSWGATAHVGTDRLVWRGDPVPIGIHFVLKTYSLCALSIH